jgi:histidine triad (HIT) family protein
MAGEDGCIFCRIVAGTIPCVRLYEDADTLAFMDINPVHDGHCLVIPKAHYATIFDIAPEAAAAASRAAAKLARAVQQALAPDGMNLLQANGPGAAQSVGHVHWHVLPRRNGDGLAMNWQPKPGDPTRIKAIAERIRARL